MSDVFELFSEAPSTIKVAPRPKMQPLPEDPRERFRVLHAYLSEVRASVQVDDLQQQFDAELAALVGSQPKKKGKKSEPSVVDILGQEKYVEVRSKYETIMDEMLTFRREETDKVQILLNQAADLITVTPGSDWHKVDSVSSSAYNTQGLGAHSYARANAEERANHYAMAGLRSEVRTRWMRDEYPDDKVWARSDLAHYDVWVQAEPENCDIAKYKSGLSLKDWLQWCWDRAINPRVMMPYLPWGIEEKLGVVIGRVRPTQGE